MVVVMIVERCCGSGGNGIVRQITRFVFVCCMFYVIGIVIVRQTTRFEVVLFVVGLLACGGHCLLLLLSWLLLLFDVENDIHFDNRSFGPVIKINIPVLTIRHFNVI